MDASLLIYCNQITPRIEYIFDFMLDTICGFDIKLTTNKEEYSSYNGAVINYSADKIKDNEIQFIPNRLLIETNIEEKKVEVVHRNNQHLVFINSSTYDDQSFDPFAAAFFLVSRYEEYLPFKADKFNRFEAEASVLYQFKVLDKPLINEWAFEIRKKVINTFPQVKTKQSTFKAEISIDIDQAFAFKYRGLRSNILSFINNLFSGRKELFKYQLQTSIFNKPDPFDTYDYLKNAQETSGLNFIYFINVGKYSSFDKNLSPGNLNLKSLLKKISTHAQIGLHPSYYSNEQPGKFQEERKTLETLVEKKVTKSRQHYLKLQFPHTYKHLLAAGIANDYSMGYASRPGFRAGTCTPFYWFNLESNCVTDLKVFPISFMDGSLGEDLHMTTTEAIDYIKKITETIKQFNSYYLSVWHNHTVNDKFYWKGWKDVFEQSIQLIK